MAICGHCEQEMTTAATCAETHVEYPDGVRLPVVPYENEHVAPEDRATQRCHDCNVAYGQTHHPGCDMERCPRCGGQLIACGCLSTDDDE